MATADRLYEAACECRDLEESYGRVLRENARLRAELDAARLAAGDLLAALDGADLPAGALGRAQDLAFVISPG